MRTAARILRRTVVAALVVTALAALAILAWYLVRPEQARSWRQAAVIGSSLAASRDDSESRIAALLGNDITDARVEQVAGTPATVVEPKSSDPAPAVLMLVPNDTGDADERDVRAAQRAFATAGFNAWAVRVLAIDDLLTDEDAPDRIRAVIEEVASTDRGTADRRVAVIASGPAASLVLRLSVEDDLDANVTSIVAVQPIGDARELSEFAVNEELDVPDALSGVVSGLVDAGDEAGLFWESLPDEVQAQVDAYSPLAVADQIDARVVLVRDPSQPAELQEEVDKLDAAIDDARVVELPEAVLDADLADLVGVSAWWLQRAGA